MWYIKMDQHSRGEKENQIHENKALFRLVRVRHVVSEHFWNVFIVALVFWILKGFRFENQTQTFCVK